MLKDNLKALRTRKGLSQEELAVRLSVVRQTVSKWEKGLSVPDAELLIRIAEVLDTSVGELLGEPAAPAREETSGGESELKRIADKLEQLNALLAERNARSRAFLRVLGIVLIAAVVVLSAAELLPALVASVISGTMLQGETAGQVGIIGGADGPTAVFVTTAEPDALRLIVAAVLCVAALVIGIVLLKKSRRS